ncbi:MAG: hypothetical protein M0011_02595 [Elusimicrobia bacterium]|nr:hypothetical protein [Elusimicrobiota bacterium]
MDANDASPSGFNTLRRIEEELFGGRRAPAAQAGPAVPKAEPYERRMAAPELHGGSWRMSREILAVKRELAALRDENDSLHLEIMEQNVKTTSTISALRDLRQDYDRLGAEMHYKELQLESQAAEIAKLKAEVEKERARCLELAEKAAWLAGQAEITGGMARARHEAASQPQAKPSGMPAPTRIWRSSSGLRKDFVPFRRGRLL